MVPTQIALPCLLLTTAIIAVAGEYFTPFNVSYDHRALIIDGHRRMLISAGIHYPRATPQACAIFCIFKFLLNIS